MKKKILDISALRGFLKEISTKIANIFLPSSINISWNRKRKKICIKTSEKQLLLTERENYTRIGNFYIHDDKVYDVQGHHILTTDESGVFLSDFVQMLIQKRFDKLLNDKENGK